VEVGQFRASEPIGGWLHEAARLRFRQKIRDSPPTGARLIAAATQYPPSCRAANDGKRQRSGSALAKRSFPARMLPATPIPSARGLQRKRRTHSIVDLRVSLPGSSRGPWYGLLLPRNDIAKFYATKYLACGGGITIARCTVLRVEPESRRQVHPNSLVWMQQRKEFGFVFEVRTPRIPERISLLKRLGAMSRAERRRPN